MAVGGSGVSNFAYTSGVARSVIGQDGVGGLGVRASFEGGFNPANIEDLIVWIDPESNAGTDIQSQAESVLSEDGVAWIDPESNAGTDLKAQAESVMSEDGVAWIDAEANT